MVFQMELRTTQIENNSMSRYTAKNKEGALIVYGFDQMGLQQGLFIEDHEDKSWDTRKFIADEGCHLKGKGEFVEKMLELKKLGFTSRDMAGHIRLAAMDLPF